MRTVMICLLVLLSGAARADQLADANKLLVEKSYPQALAMFSQLAAQGNAEAQLRLGEMYWYGEGVALDRAKGDALFAQAAASGNPGAIAAAGMSAERARRMGDIAYWTGAYDGADLKAGRFDCAAPAIPAVSKTNADIQATTGLVNAWTACHNGFLANLADALPLGKRIPEDVLMLMSEQELAQARAHLDKVYGAVLGAAKKDADLILARHAEWNKATGAYVASTNDQTAARTLHAIAQVQEYERGRAQVVSQSREQMRPGQSIAVGRR